MELDERLRWIETRVTSSLKPRAEELKHLFTNEESRTAMFDFCNNEDIKNLYIFSLDPPEGGLVASLTAPQTIREKAMFFIKSHSAGKVMRDNIMDEVAFCDCSNKPLTYLSTLLRDVYLPLLSIEMGGSVSADKLMDLLHRLAANMEVTEGSIQDQVILPLPSIEVLSEAAAYSSRRPAVIHVLETTVVNWIKQIKGILKIDPEAEIARRFGPKPGPLDEIEMWSEHLEKISSINEQLCSHVALNIIMNLEDAHSTYSQSFHLVKREITKAEAEANDNLQFLSTLLPWFEQLHHSTKSKEMVELFSPLMHTLFLVWAHSRYYHENKNFTRLLTMLSNEVVARARQLVGRDVLENLTESFSSLKDSLRVCAAFRGCYLDKKDKADDLNQKKLSEQIGTNVESGGIVWHSKLYIDSITPKAGKLFSRTDQLTDSMNDLSADVWTDSSWPPRNHPSFISLNNFMERCNDVLELVQTTRHFELLTCAAEVGGAGGDSLDCLVREIHEKFTHAIRSFQDMTQDVLDVDETRDFEREFFMFRSVTRDLEFNLADVLRQSFKQCWDTRAKLRLLEVFEGISGREMVQANLKDIFTNMVKSFTEELIKVRSFFEQHINDPPSHPHLPPVASKVLWLRGLKLHIQEPMSRLSRVSPTSLKGDDGWRLRDTFTELLKDIEKCESDSLRKWQNDMQTELRAKLKQPLLIADINSTSKSPMIQVNFDPDLLLLLREIHYLASPPFNVRLPDPVRVLLRSTDDGLLRSTAARLDTIVSRYNSIISTMEEFEKPLFEQKMAKIEELLHQGLHEYSWKTLESADFVEHASFLVCDDVHYNLGIVQSNYQEICSIAGSWSTNGQLDMFTPRDTNATYSMDEIHSLHREIYDMHKNTIIIGGNRIHALLQSTFEAVQISRASPSWQSYTQFVSDVILAGLKESTLTSLQSMLNQIVHFNLTQDTSSVPILTIRLELVGLEVTFNPTLDDHSASHSVQEYVHGWLQDFLNRGDLFTPVDSERKTYKTSISVDDQIQRLAHQITEVVEQNAEECKEILATFREYAFLWMQDVQRTFKEFLAGNIVAHPRKMNRAEAIRSRASQHSEKSKKDKEKDIRSSSRASAAASSLSTSGAFGLSEKTFLNPKRLTSLKEVKEDNVPSLDDFDREIEIYQTARDEINALQDWCDVGWMRVNMRPIKQVLGTYASKWMFVYTKHLSDQVSTTLNDLDSFLKRIEPGIEAITGQEQDIASFMRLMRVFNEVSTQQAEMDSKFVAMKRTITLLEKYGQKLPDMTQKFYAAAPQRWNNLKMKVNKAKQRLGPRIQAEAKSVTEELKAFGDRCEALSRQFASSEAFQRTCAIYTAFNLMDAFGKKLEAMEGEAQDLIELQELFEKVVVNFSILPQLRGNLECLRQVWHTYRAVQEQHTEWKRGRWQRINTRLMRKATEAQLDVVRALPNEAQEWDVYQGMEDSIYDIQACLPIIDDLSKSAMRPRHWKQLLRLAGGVLQISNEGLTRMTLGQLLDLGLHNHADEVRGIIQRATKDVAIESSLKTYEEVWLSKIFELRPHTRYKGTTSSAAGVTQENTGSEFGKDSEFEMHGHRGLSSRVSVTSHGSGGFSIKDSKTRKTSIASATFSQSLITLTQDNGPVCLLDSCDPIFEELEDHQVSLQSMLNGSSAGSFADDIVKWQKRLQTIEAVLTVWLEVQEKWIELEEVFTSLEFRIAMPHETNLFSAVNRDFRILMKATEKNPNVLQACSRTNIQTKLEKLNMNLQQCWKSLLSHLERRRQKFPRFYFLSHEDVLHVVCNGYDPGLVNPYLFKVLEHLGRLDYEEFEAEGQKYFQITDVVSNHGEKLALKQPVICDGPIDGWLTTLIGTVKQTLTEQLFAVLDTIQSDKPNHTTEKDTEKTDMSNSCEEPRRLLSMDICCQVILVVLQVQWCRKVEDAVEKAITGDKAAVNEVLDSLTRIVSSLAMRLRGTEVDTIRDGRQSTIHKDNMDGNMADENQEGKKSGTTSVTPDRTPSALDMDGRSDISGSSGRGADNNECVPPSNEVQPDRKVSRVLLTPSQLQKISNMITILSHKRELVQDLIRKLQDATDIQSMDEWFAWLAHARYSCIEEKQTCNASILDMRFEYGFEYQGTVSRLAISPFTDKCLMGLAKCLKAKVVGLCTGTPGCGKTETVKELSLILGYPLYSFNSSNNLTRAMLVDVCRGLASSGSWVCFNNISTITPVVMSILTRLLQVIHDGLRANKSAVIIEEEEVPLMADAACFATLTNSISIKIPDYIPNIGFFPSFQSSISELPKDILNLFRPVALMGPDWLVILEVWLTSQGFTKVTTISSKMVSLRELCSELLPSTSKVLLGDTAGCVHKCSSWGLLSLKRIIENAGTHLNQCQEVTMTNNVPQRTTPDGGRPPSPTDATEAVAAANEPVAGSSDDTAEGFSSNAKDQDTLRVEEQAIVLALRDTFMPQLSGSDAIMFATLLSDLFPIVQIPMIFDSYGVVKGKMALNEPVSNLEEIPVTPKSRQGSAAQDKLEVLDDIESAIKVATSKLGLQPGVSFQSRVVQLSELIATHKVVCVTGPSGCGKTECIQTLSAAYREMGHQVKTDVICTETLESQELLGYNDPLTNEWKEGLLAVALRKHSRMLSLQETRNKSTCKPLMKWLHLDGTIDSTQMDIFSSLIQNTGTVVLGNNEHIIIPKALQIVWELETLDNLSPAVLSSLGMLVLNSSDVNWPLLVERWLCKRPEREVEVLRELCDRYIGPSLEYLASKTCVPPEKGAPPGQDKPSQLRHVVPVNEMGMVNTLLTLVEAIISNYQDLMPGEFENYFCYAAMWAFGGTLEEKHKKYFSNWWKKQWIDFVSLPGDDEIWNFYVNPETHEFLNWREAVPPYAQTAAEGIPNEAYVHTINNERISHLVGLMADAGKPVLLVGEEGSGKTSILRHRLKQHGGDIGEVLSLTVYCNKFTTGRSLWHEVSDCLEWKHAHTFVPKGNKKLTCLVDDLNLSKVSNINSQSACELVRQHIDHGGVFDPETKQWKEVHHVSYLSSYNPYTPPTTPKLSTRLLRHFSVFNVSFPSISELHYIYTQQLEKHFLLNIIPSQSGGTDTSSQGSGDSHVKHTGIGYHDHSMKELLSNITYVTLELQDYLRTMYLPTAQRCHYMFTMTDLTMVFRNLCLTLRPGCSHHDLLLLWKHECDWVYSRRLIDLVDKERYQQAFVIAAKKRLSSEDQLSIVNGQTPFFTNLIDLEDNSGEVIGGGSSDANDDDVHLAYRHVTDMNKVRAVLEHGIDEYNKDFPRIKITLHDDVMETICRLVRIIQSPHECGHALIVSEGSPGLATKLAQLAARLCDYSVTRINPSSISNSDKYTLDNFKTDLVQAYTRAGVKGEHLLLLLPESDIFREDFLVYVSEFLVSCSISHLFTEEEQTSVINAVRTEVTQAGLTYTKDVAWDFFLKTVRENLRVVMTCTSLGEDFQRRCRALPALTNTVSIILMAHWSKQGLVSHASHHLKGVKIFNSLEKENLAHLMASMHLSLRHQEFCDVEAGKYGHLTNTTFEIFVEKFINLVTKRQLSLQKEHEQVEAALKTIENGVFLAEELKKQLEHEIMVLEQKKKGNEQLLMQIGQDKAIAEEQVRLVKRQQERIKRLKKALPEYQMAHERAVFKAAAVVSDTKRVLKTLDQQGLTELRTMQKPDAEIEDLLAAIIIIVKSPTSDLTWNKGAKRLMANLDRFREELGMFDDIELPPSTLEVVEPYLKKPHFSGDYLERKTNNSAVGSLVQWVRGVVRYHRMMQSKVKPLHAKVAETSSAEDIAVEKMSTMDEKLKGLEERLKTLAVAYEDASIDKCRQYELTQNLDMKLKQAAYFEQVLSSGRQKWLSVQTGIKERKAAMAGGVAIAAAFATYLGPYSFSFRRDMMTVHWPQCLEERGVPLVLDASPPYPEARVFKTEGLIKTESTLTEKDKQQGSDESRGGSRDSSRVASRDGSRRGTRDESRGGSRGSDGSRGGSRQKPRDTGEGVLSGDEAVGKLSEDGKDENSNYQVNEISSDEVEKQDAEQSEKAQTLSQPERKLSETSQGKEIMNKTLIDYDAFSLAIAKLLLGDGPVRKLLTKGLGLRKIENAVLASSSWQRVPLLIDPNTKSLEMIRMLERGQQVLELDLGESDQSTVVQIEKAITSGTVLVLYNIDQHIDSLFMPLIHHINTAISEEPFKDPQVVKFGSRRVTCNPNFRLYLVSRVSDPVFSTEVASITTLINFELCDEGLGEELALEAFSRVRPELYIEGRKTLLAVVELLKTLEDVDGKLMNRIMTKEGTSIWDETELIAELVQSRTEVTRRLLKAMKNLERLSHIRSQFRDLAKRGVVLFSLMKDLSKVQHEYRFSLGYFMGLFRQAVGKDFNIAEGERVEYEDEPEDGENPSHTSVIIKINDEETAEKGLGQNASSSSTISKRTSVILPSEVELPSPNVEYRGLTDNDTRSLQAALTKEFYFNVSRSIYEEHRLLFATLVFLILRMDKKNKDELQILLTGGHEISHGLTLADFDPTLLKPGWISPDGWQSLLAMSTMKGPLDSLCADVASNPSEWKQWYDSDTPEAHQTPKPLSSFHKLLLVSCLRPDRFKQAMRVAVTQSLTQLIETTAPSFKDILFGIPHSVPVFILMPKQCSLNLPFTVMPVSVIQKLAESQNVSCNYVSVGQVQESLIDVALATAVRTDSWLVIDNLQLASRDWLDQLYNRLLRLHLQASPRTQSQWRVFLISESSPQVPEVLLLFAHQLAWDVVHRQERYQFLSTGELDIRETIIQTLQSVPAEYWSNVREQNLGVRTAIFGFCVLHSILLLRQRFGTRALNGYYPFSLSDLLMGMDLIIGAGFNKKQQSGSMTWDADTISQVVYAGKVVNQWDQRYIATLTHMILHTKGSCINLGQTKIPLPPVNVEPEDYTQWFIEKTSSDSWSADTVVVLSLHSSVQRELRQSRVEQFFHHLRMLLLPSIIPKPQEPRQKASLPIGRALKLSALRNAMDLCLDKLPNLLKIEIDDAVPIHKLMPRVLSQLRALSQYSEASSVGTAESERLSESMGYVLQKECEWFNCQLYYVRHILQTLEQCVLAGSPAIPSSLNDVVLSLQNERVPLSWLHPNSQPSPHSLSSWLEDFQLRHKQFTSWIQEGMVPKAGSEPVLGRGRLKSVWLGGLACPGAVVSSLKHEKAAMSGCNISEVCLHCCAFDKNTANRLKTEEDDGIVLMGIYMEGAEYDEENDCIKQSTSSFKAVADLLVRPVLYSNLEQSETSMNNEQATEDSSLPLYNCPVYMTRSRQMCAFTAPVKSSVEPEDLTLSGVAMVLNPGDVPREPGN